MEETQIAICINDKTTRDKKVKVLGITEGKEYKVKPSKYANYYELVNDLGQVETYFVDRFKVVEGKKMEDKTIKVRCIKKCKEDLEALEIGKEYSVLEESKEFYLIANDKDENDTWYSKKLFEKVEDVLIVECIDNGQALSLTLNKKYKVIEEDEENYLIINDKNIENRYLKSRFKPVKPQKEIKKNFREVIADIKEGEEWKCRTTIISMNENKIRIKDTECDSLESYTYSEDHRGFIKVEEPKPVTTAEAFKALDEGKIIESLVSDSKYKKENGLICAKNLEVYSRTNLIYSLELEGQWIIIEGEEEC